jgi:predicted histidine transporter YuiF (NhaC family)
MIYMIFMIRLSVLACVSYSLFPIPYSLFPTLYPLLSTLYLLLRFDRSAIGY